MKNRKVKFKTGWCTVSDPDIIGTVLDSFISYEMVRSDLPSGMGGTTSGNVPISVTKYLIVSDEGKIYTVDPDKIREIIPFEKTN